MKSYLAIFTLIALLCVAPPFAYADNPSAPTPPPVETVTINKSDLTPEQLQKLQTQAQVKQITSNVQTVSQWAGAGKEIGVAIKEGLGAASDGVANFAATPPGKLTMFLIAWKVMYKDVFATAQTLTGVVIGVPLLIAVDWFVVLVYWRSTRSRRVLVSSEGLFRKKVYAQEDSWFLKMNDDAQLGTQALFFIGVVCVNALIFCGVIFHA